jgi:hypothetical protein
VRSDAVLGDSFLKNVIAVFDVGGKSIISVCRCTAALTAIQTTRCASRREESTKTLLLF